MKKFLVLAFITLSCSYLKAQNNELWTKVVTNSNQLSNKGTSTNSQNGALAFHLNQSVLEQKLATINDNGEIMELRVPNANGDLESFMVKEYSNFDPELQAKYPNIRAYTGVGKTDKNASICLSACPTGIQTMVFRADEGTELIETADNDKLTYLLKTSKNGGVGEASFACTTDAIGVKNNLSNKSEKIASNDKVLKTFRLALSASGEYTAYFGGTVQGALAGMNATMTRVNTILGRDVAVKLVIIPESVNLIYTNAATDPYSTGPVALGVWNKEIQTTMTNVITESKYDLGHLFSRAGGVGNAGCLGCVCVSPTTAQPYGKGAAYSSAGLTAKPEGDSFDLVLATHEFGHQLGAYHVFSYVIEGTGSSIELGSGATIMSYSGSTGLYDLQTTRNTNFSFKSIQEIQTNLSRKTCQVNTPITNNPPTANAGPNYTIPKGTAFVLKGTGTDSDGDTLTYTWEENDVAKTSDYANSLAVPTKLDGPLFIPLLPSSSPTRYFPALASVLNNNLTSPKESPSSIPRILNFVFTVRDNVVGVGQTNSSSTVVTVTNDGPFTITYPKEANISWTPSNKETITWNVNGTNLLPGATNVNIKLSTDGGLSFPLLLATATPNDGSETITVPSGIISTDCRILIEPVGNVFYAINPTPFSIGSSTITSCTTYNLPTPFPFPRNPNINASADVKKVFVPKTTDLISKFTINVKMTQPALHNIQISLISPRDTNIIIFDGSCLNTQNANLDLVFDDDATTPINCSSNSSQTIKPTNPLARFIGENPYGEWYLYFIDNSPKQGLAGNVSSISFNFCSRKQVPLSKPDYEINDFIMYPNPTKGSFNIKFTSQSNTGIKVSINDLLGRKIFENQYDSEVLFNKDIKVPNAFSGIYMVTVEDGERKTVKKLIIE